MKLILALILAEKKKKGRKKRSWYWLKWSAMWGGGPGGKGDWVGKGGFPMPGAPGMPGMGPMGVPMIPGGPGPWGPGPLFRNTFSLF